jgi:hypothetical protein
MHNSSKYNFLIKVWWSTSSIAGCRRENMHYNMHSKQWVFSHISNPSGLIKSLAYFQVPLKFSKDRLAFLVNTTTKISFLVFDHWTLWSWILKIIWNLNPKLHHYNCPDIIITLDCLLTQDHTSTSTREEKKFFSFSASVPVLESLFLAVCMPLLTLSLS